MGDVIDLHFAAIAPIMQAHSLSQSAHHAPVMYGSPLTTFKDFLDRDQGLACWCPGCKSEAYTDVAMLVRNGLADHEVKRHRPRCRKCGSVGVWSFTGPR
jgi:hypothetical protein